MGNVDPPGKKTEEKEKENGQGWESKFPWVRGLGISRCQMGSWEDGRLVEGGREEGKVGKGRGHVELDRKSDLGL